MFFFAFVFKSKGQGVDIYDVVDVLFCEPSFFTESTSIYIKDKSQNDFFTFNKVDSTCLDLVVCKSEKLLRILRKKKEIYLLTFSEEKTQNVEEKIFVFSLNKVFKKGNRKKINLMVHQDSFKVFFRFNNQINRWEIFNVKHPARYESLKEFTNLGVTEIDSSLTSLFNEMKTASYQLRNDSLAPLFKDQLLGYLAHPVTFRNELDSLSRYLTVRTSPDKKIKFYSWDNNTGGAWHDISCVAQFEKENGELSVKLVSPEKYSDGEYTDSKVYDVFEINTGEEMYYITFSWGTHGGGRQHQLVQVFKIENDSLIKCNSCFEDNQDLIIEYPRGEKVNLTFDTVSNSIQYAGFILDEDTGFYTNTGKSVTLEFIDGVFKVK